jgi:hypothetical protein
MTMDKTRQNQVLVAAIEAKALHFSNIFDHEHRSDPFIGPPDLFGLHPVFPAEPVQQGQSGDVWHRISAR